MSKRLQPHEKALVKAVIGAIILLLLPLFATPRYEWLQEKEITVLGTFYSEGTGRYERTRCAVNAGDMFYNVMGALSSVEEFENIPPNTPATIKYHWFLWWHVSELTADGKQIVSYNRGFRQMVQTICIIVAAVWFLEASCGMPPGPICGESCERNIRSGNKKRINRQFNTPHRIISRCGFENMGMQIGIYRSVYCCTKCSGGYQPPPKNVPFFGYFDKKFYIIACRRCHFAMQNGWRILSAATLDCATNWNLFYFRLSAFWIGRKKQKF